MVKIQGKVLHLSLESELEEPAFSLAGWGARYLSAMLSAAWQHGKGSGDW